MTFVVAQILAKKRDKKALSAEEIAFLVNGISSGEIPDYQASAFLMAAGAAFFLWMLRGTGVFFGERTSEQVPHSEPVETGDPCQSPTSSD